jgi:hypothetical protein
MGDAVVHFEIMGDGEDASGLVDFYTELFGWTAIPRSDDGSYFDIDTDTTNGIPGGIGAAPGEPGVTLYVAVDDVGGTLARAVELGGQAVTEPIQDTPDAVAIADVADAEGNVLSLVGKGPLPERVDAGGEHPVVHFEIHGYKWEDTRDFWTSLFDWEVNDYPDYGYSIVQPDDPGIGGGIAKSAEGENLVTFYVQVQDLQAILDRAEDLGGSTTRPVFGDPDGQQFALLADPDGNVIGILT